MPKGVRYPETIASPLLDAVRLTHYAADKAAYIAERDGWSAEHVQALKEIERALMRLRVAVAEGRDPGHVEVVSTAASPKELIAPGPLTALAAQIDRMFTQNQREE